MQNIQIDASIVEYLKSLTLLCVEDNRTTQFIYRSVFEDLVKEIIFAKDGKEGYEKFFNNNIDLIISDYDMPLLNGIEMIRKIRQENEEIPIILVSAIQDVDVIVQALQLNVNNFLKKPIVTTEVMQAIVNVTKLLIANNYLKEQRERKIRELETKERYKIYQEDLAFAKELNILRNDFYYQMLDNCCMALIDFFYKPLDTLSGDAYSARKIDSNTVLYFIVDGMGKGLSASLSSMLMTSYLNHLLDIREEEFNLKNLIESALIYIKTILLDEEMLSMDFFVLDYKNLTMEYAKFAMPASLLESNEHKIIKIKSNNPPISKYSAIFKTDTIDISCIIKFLFYSDGIPENSVRYEKKLYGEFLEDDFLASFTKDELRERILWRIDEQEDDMTFIFINQLTLGNRIEHIKKVFPTTLEAVEEANEWYSDFWSSLTNNYKVAYNAGVVFTELFMNAYEHGNLGVDASTKHALIEEDKYFTTLEKIQSECKKELVVTINVMEFGSKRYITTLIKDEGRGFDTNILSKIFRDKKNFNGRGVYISRQSSLGIYYNTKGNSVLFLHRLESEA